MPDWQEVQAYYKRFLNIAEGAAISTGTTHKVFLITSVHERTLNRPLKEALQGNFELVGVPEFDELTRLSPTSNPLTWKGKDTAPRSSPWPQSQARSKAVPPTSPK